MPALNAPVDPPLWAAVPLSPIKIKIVFSARSRLSRNLVITLPDSKTGKKPVYLGASAVKVFKDIERIPGNPYVITGQIEGQHLTDMQKPWRRIRKAAGLDDVRLHDLRHTFASNGIAIGEGLPVIGNLLGHTQAQTTARYTHLANHHAIAAADRISESVANALL